MGTHRFEVEQVFSASDGQGVFAFVRSLDPTPFSVPPGSTLDGLPLRAGLDQPRALRHDGTPRTDLYVVRMENAADVDRLRAGSQVTLAWPDP